MAIKLPKEFYDLNYEPTISFPSPTMVSDKKEDGSFSIRYGYSFATLNDYVRDIARDMNENIESGIIAELLTLNGYVPEKTCRIDMSTYEQGGIVKCDACGKRIPTKHRNTHAVEAKYPYCPWCGARIVD